jgi:SAM-dependent methyltransferase
VFVPETQWLSIAAEHARYAHHDNSPSNQGYLRFLGEVAVVVCGLVGSDARILDFGSGEQAVLSGLLQARGLPCTAYDPLYGLGNGALDDQYDVIVLCEVIEHLRDLRAELLRLAGCLRPGGHLVVRTQCYPSLAELSSWWYARDPTHINFFCPNTLQLAARLCRLTWRQSATPDISIWSASE